MVPPGASEMSATSAPRLCTWTRSVAIESTRSFQEDAPTYPRSSSKDVLARREVLHGADAHGLFPSPCARIETALSTCGWISQRTRRVVVADVCCFTAFLGRVH